MSWKMQSGRQQQILLLDFDEEPEVKKITKTITADDEDDALAKAQKLAAKDTKAADFHYVDLNKITDLTTGEIIYQE